jgi:hypothetical protein
MFFMICPAYLHSPGTCDQEIASIMYFALILRMAVTQSAELASVW